MKRALKFVVALLLPASLTAQEKVPVFVYSPGPGDGLHIAVQDGSSWREAGRLCSSDYGTWGAEKKMFHPSVWRAQDGT